MNKCEVCGNEYESKRSTSRYCSSKCRVGASRVSVTDSVTKVSVTPLSVTLSDGQVWDPNPALFDTILSWYDGEGTEYQRRLATLSLQYDVIRGCLSSKIMASKVL